MAEKAEKKTGSTHTPAAKKPQVTGPRKPWGTKTSDLPKYVMDSLYQVTEFLAKDARERLGLIMKIPVFIQDPLVALENPALGVEEVDVHLEAGMESGPTSSRIRVVDFDPDTQKLTEPVAWDREAGWFQTPPPEVAWLPDAPAAFPPHGMKLQDLTEEEQAQSQSIYQDFIGKTIKNVHFHQVNAWAVVQRVLEFYEDPQALGRPVPWGFDGNRLVIMPHAGKGENAFYDRHSKSLQFSYFGDAERPTYTCLSHDVIAHESGHAILDGIRPLYYQPTSIQTAAFHEFIGDLTAILLALFNKDIRHFIARQTQGNLQGAEVLANIAEQFGQQVRGRPYLRSAINKLTIHDVQNSLTPHHVSKVLTGAMFDILIGIAKMLIERNAPGETGQTSGGMLAGAEPTGRRVTPEQAVWWAADRFRRVALQPLDLCPPCDIQFLDYARAVLRNDILTNPVDEHGTRAIMLSAFHQRGLCGCGRLPGEDLPEDCLFKEALYLDKMDFVYHDIGRVSRSRTAAYYFLSDNRQILRIPAQKDIVVVDLYDTNKFGAAAERLPREVVLEYHWQEEVPLQGGQYGRLNGKTFPLDCGGTLVFDDRGNLLSWFRKPGTEHIEMSVVDSLRQREREWRENPEEARRKNIKKLTRHELDELADLEEGQRRKDAFLDYLADVTEMGLVGEPQPQGTFLADAKPVIAIEEGGVVRFEMAPHLRSRDEES